MYKKVFFIIFAATLAMSDGIQPTNYEISRNQLGGGNYGNYPYPTGPGYYPGHGQYGQGHYGQHHGPPGPPGAHPGCPLCDSSVYSYCYQKQAHDACCCGHVFNPYCGKTDCKFLYANSCEEHDLISNCCCVDLYKNNPQGAPIVPAVAV